MCEKYECTRDHLCGKRRCVPISKEKPFKANWDLSDAMFLDRYTRLGFEFYAAVKHPNNDLPLSRYLAAGPAPPDLPFPRYPAARLRAELVSHCFLIFLYLPAAIGPEFFYNLASPIKYHFQQLRAVKFIFSQGRIKQDFLLTSSESVALFLNQQVLAAGSCRNEIENNSINLSIKKGVQ